MSKNKITPLENNYNNPLDFTTVTNDFFGSPRYVCHYLDIADTYEEALQIAKEFGGKKFNNKQYGGGIVFNTYGLRKLTINLLLSIGKASKYYSINSKGCISIRTFLNSDVTNDKGNLKKWIKILDNQNNSVKYILSKNL